MRQFLSGLITVSVATLCLATEFKLKRYITVRQEVEGVLKPIGYLAPGAVVRIAPSEISASTDEEVVLKWLQSHGTLKYFEVNGQVKKDYFYPVEIVSSEKSKGVRDGQMAFISLRYLARRNGLELVVTKKTEAMASEVHEFDKMKTALEPLVKRVDRTVNRNIKNRRVVNSRVLKSCPIAFEDFLKEAESVATRNRIPMELLLSVMQVESGGNCLSLRREKNGTSSVGLFQVNTGTTSVPPCTSGQLHAMKLSTDKEDLRTIRCLENPLTNVEVATEILRDKYASVNTRRQPPAKKWQAQSGEERDAWRKALAAYNGGQSYVFQAFRDIRSFNRKNGFQLNPDNWEHRRIFFLRRWLARDLQSQMFDSSQRVRRRLYDTVLNLAYVESIAGRKDGVKGLVDRWQGELARYQVAGR